MNVLDEVHHHITAYAYRTSTLTAGWASGTAPGAGPYGGLWLGVTLVEGGEQAAATAVLGPVSQVGGLEGALALFYLGLLHARADRPSAALGAFHRAAAIELPQGPLLPALLEAGILTSALGQGDLASSYFSALLIRGGYERRFLSLMPLHALYWFNRALSTWVPRVATLLSDCPTLGAGATKLSDRAERVIGRLLDDAARSAEEGQTRPPEQAGRWRASAAPRERLRILIVASKHIGCSELFVENDITAQLFWSAARRGHAVTLFRADKILYGHAAGDPLRQIDGLAFRPSPAALQGELQHLRETIAELEPDLILLEANFIPTETTIGPAFFAGQPWRRRTVVIGVVADLNDKFRGFAEAWLEAVDQILCFHDEGERARQVRAAGKLLYLPHLPFLENPYRDDERAYDFVFAGSLTRGRDAVLSSVCRFVGSHRVELSQRRIEGQLPAVDSFYRFLASGRTTFNTGYTEEARSPIRTGRVAESFLAKTALIEESAETIAKNYLPYVHFIPVHRAAQVSHFVHFLCQHPDHRRRMVEAAYTFFNENYSADHFWTAVEAAVESASEASVGSSG